MATLNSDFQRIRRQESHAHTDYYSDGPETEAYLSNLENVEVVVFVDHISPESYREQYEAVGREERHFIEGTDISERNYDLGNGNRGNGEQDILVGAEVDTFPGIKWTRDVLEQNSETLDLAHVSHHYLPDGKNGMRAVKDGDFRGYENPVSVYFDRVDETMDMLEGLEVDIPIVVAHLGLLENNHSIPHNEPLLRENYSHVLNRIADMPNVYPELNLKTEERVNCNSVNELEDMLQKGSEFETTVWTEELMRSGVEHTVGSDVHRLGETEIRMELACEILDPSEVERAIGAEKLVN